MVVPLVVIKMKITQITMPPTQALPLLLKKKRLNRGSANISGITLKSIFTNSH